MISRRALLWAPVLLLLKARAHGFVRPVYLASAGIRTSSVTKGLRYVGAGFRGVCICVYTILRGEVHRD